MLRPSSLTFVTVVAVVTVVAAVALMSSCDRAPSVPEPAAPAVEAKAAADAPKTVQRETPAERKVALELQAALAEARLHDDVARFRDVERRAAEALVQHPGSRPLLTVRVASLLALGRANDALVDARALALDAEDATAAGLLADALMATGNITAAVDAVERMMSLSPGLPSYARAAQLRFAIGDVDGSVEMWREAYLTGHKSQPEGLAFCATGMGDALLYGSGDVDGALVAYDSAVRAIASYPAARIGRARVHLAADRVKEALADLDAIDAAARTAESVSLRSVALARAKKSGASGVGVAKEALAKEIDVVAERDATQTALALAVHRLDLGKSRALLEQREKDGAALLDTAAHAYVVSLGEQPASASAPASAPAKTATTATTAKTATTSATADSRVLALSGLALSRTGNADDATAARAMLARVKTVGLDPALADEVRTALGAAR